MSIKNNYATRTGKIIVHILERECSAPLERILVTICDIKGTEIECGYSNANGYYMSVEVANGLYFVKVKNERDGKTKFKVVLLSGRKQIARTNFKFFVNLKREKRKNKKNHGGWNYDNNNWSSSAATKKCSLAFGRKRDDRRSDGFSNAKTYGGATYGKSKSFGGGSSRASNRTTGFGGGSSWASNSSRQNRGKIIYGGGRLR